MSEAEKKRRREYKINRKKKIMIFSLILCGLILFTTVFGLIYRELDKTLFVSYRETSSISYEVKLFENEYFEGEWQSPNQSYVSELTDKIKANFKYDMLVDEDEVPYHYTYTLETMLVVADKFSRVPIYRPVDVVQTPVSVATSGDDGFDLSVMVDYAGYRAQATEFIKVYKLTDVDAYIDVTLYVHSAGNRADTVAKTYTTTLKLPLLEETFRPETITSLPVSATQHLECESGIALPIFHVLTIVFLVLSVLGAAFLVAFIYLTRNDDINYAIRVKRLIASYKSFIQEMKMPFATEGYQIVYIKNFNEMLEVRETIGSPLLMYRNEDDTATTFVIPSSMGIIYWYEIRVEDYNEIYGIPEGNTDFENVQKPCFVKILCKRISELLHNPKKKPVEEISAEESSAEEASAEEAPAEEAPAEEAPAEETPAEDTPAEESSAEES